MNKRCLFCMVTAIVALLSITSCEEKKEELPIIFQLVADKSEDIVFGEKINLSATSEGDAYKWSCDGGTLEGVGRQVKWIAPAKVGKYVVSVGNGGKSVEHKELNVVGLFFDTFSDLKKSWSQSSFLNTSIENEKILLKNTSTTETAQMAHTFTPEISLPYSFKTKIALSGTSWNDVPNGVVSFYLYFAKPENPASAYLMNVYLGISPKSTGNKWSIRYGTNSPDGKNPQYFDLEANTKGTKTIFDALDQFKTISVSINKEKEFLFLMDGEEICRSSALKSIISNYENTDLKLGLFRYVLSPSFSVLVDDFYFTNDGTILN